MTNPDDLKYLNVEELRPAAEGAEGAPPSAAKRVRRGSRKVAGTASDVTHATADRVKSGSKSAWDATTSIATTLMATTQGILSLRLAEGLNDLLQNMVKGTATIYDGVTDAEDLAAQAGSAARHRLFDGGHTILGAVRESGGASPEDAVVREGLGTVQGLLRDVTPIRGLPLANWDGATFERVAGALESGFHIPKSWFYDLSAYDAAELLGGAVGAVALTFSWSRAQTETFARLVGGMGLSATISANPPAAYRDRRVHGQGLPQGPRDGGVRRTGRRPSQGRRRRGRHAVGGCAGGRGQRPGGRGAAGRADGWYTRQQDGEEGERDPDQPIPGRQDNRRRRRGQEHSRPGERRLRRLRVPGAHGPPA